MNPPPKLPDGAVLKEKLDSLSDGARDWLDETCHRFADGEGYSKHKPSIEECLSAGLIQRKGRFIEIEAEVMDAVYSESYLRVARLNAPEPVTGEGMGKGEIEVIEHPLMRDFRGNPFPAPRFAPPPAVTGELQIPVKLQCTHCGKRSDVTGQENPTCGHCGFVYGGIPHALTPAGDEGETREHKVLSTLERMANTPGVGNDMALWNEHSNAVINCAWELAEAKRENERNEMIIRSLIQERDRNEDWADRLANKISEVTGEDIGEHSNLNNPWHEALEALDDVDIPKLRADLDSARTWRTIETADKTDGVHVLLSGKGFHGTWFVVAGYYCEDRDEWYEANTHHTDSTDGQVFPEFWMPFPPAPSSGQEQESGKTGGENE